LFVLFYVVTGVVGALAQVVVSPDSLLPTVGASGAISGVLGAYIVMFPTKRVRVLLFYFVTEVPAVFVIGLWALTQLLSGFGSLSVQGNQGGVAYMAHVGGFVAGVLGALILRRFAPPRPRRMVWGQY